ncbi:sulfur carrier protein ThiS [Amaricoccus solimangrovi]|uniref:Sulfur carrier protein ThiS n=1 Tax=Amaricoccus solimangrovi TaxID=2589815 RepID=A0A501WUH2_9RHOB|nr:sulfur carrier protein ThiS [Amaricoccus solimangrovi]TPE51027.1 sulfur carrier protein ThiS [Amaricoccus solimangrovi]
MRIVLNGEPREIGSTRLDTALDELGYGGAAVATAVNGEFVPAGSREATELAPGDRLEVVTPRQGG